MKSMKVRCCFFKYVVAEAASQVFCIKVRHCLFKYAVPGAASQVCYIKVRGRPSNLVSLVSFTNFTLKHVSVVTLPCNCNLLEFKVSLNYSYDVLSFPNVLSQLHGMAEWLKS